MIKQEIQESLEKAEMPLDPILWIPILGIASMFVKENLLNEWWEFFSLDNSIIIIKNGNNLVKVWWPVNSESAW